MNAPDHADIVAALRPDLPPLVTLTIRTRRPTDYTLTDHGRPGGTWRATADGSWRHVDPDGDEDDQADDEPRRAP